MDDPKVLFGQRLAQLRKVKGWSQETLALESGIARSYLGGVERGQRNIALLNICRLAETLGLPPSELLKLGEVASHDAAPRSSTKSSAKPAPRAHRSPTPESPARPDPGHRKTQRRRP
ncbi:MAG: helix-turn-helix transcriptional regulator [Rhodocyclaceae bacterium]|nr:helix-turn-helix transcriptional regulator [Rhodocyclaceae bacterium]